MGGFQRMGSITELARHILRQPKQDRLAQINAHADPEALKAEIIRLHTKHQGFRIYLKGKPRSVAMIDPEGATLDQALEMAKHQFGRDRVDRVITGEEERKCKT